MRIISAIQGKNGLVEYGPGHTKEDQGELIAVVSIPGGGSAIITKTGLVHDIIFTAEETQKLLKELQKLDHRP